MLRVVTKSIVLVFICLCNYLLAQSNFPTYRYYSIADGLADNNINDLLQDKYGYVWIAGQNGLTRYDGNNFVVFNSANVQDFFPNNSISKLYSDGKKIYLLSKEEGLIVLDPYRLNFEKISERGVISMSHQNDMTAHLYSDGFLELTKGNMQPLKKLLKYGSKDDIVIRNDKVYVSSYHNGIYIHNLDNLNQEGVYKEGSKTGYFLYPSKNYGVVINLSDQLFILDKNNNLVIHPDVDSRKIVTSYGEYDKSAQIIYNFKSANISDSLAFYEFLNREIPNVELKKILKINEHTLFLASNQGLIKISYKLQKHIRNIDDNDFFESKALRVRRKILEGDKGKLYMLGFPSLVEYDTESTSFKNLTDIKKPVSYYDGAIVDSVIYLTTEGSGFYCFDLKLSKLSKILLTELDSLTGLFHISVANDSILLLGGLGNIVVYNIRSKTNTTYSIGKKLNVYDIEEDKNSGTYLVATDIGLLNFKIDKSGKIIFGKKTVPTKTPVKDILADAENKQIWLATNHGVELRNSGDFTKIKEYSKPEDISHQRVTALQKDINGKIWASTYSGITVIDYRNNKTYIIDRYDGLKNEEFNYKCSAKLTNGSFVFGGINMYDIIDLKILEINNYINKFSITGIQKTTHGASKYFSESELSSGTISFNTGKEDLYIYLSNFDFQEKSGYRFEYKKANQNWVSVQNNRIRLSNLGEGSYKLSIRMLNPLGVAVDEKTFTLLAKVPFYQTRLFFGLTLVIVSLLVATSLFLLYRNSKIENITKERIAHDLHDEVGSTLTSLLMTLNNSPGISDNIKIKSGLSDALFNIRAFIDSMGGKKDRLIDFEDDLRDFLTSVIKNTSQQIIFKVEGPDIRLRKELYRDMKLCLYDIVNAFINQTDIEEIDIKMIIVKNQIIISVKNSAVEEKFLTYSHNSITTLNYRKRTERHKGSFDVSKSAEGGYIMKLQFEI